MKSPLRRLRGFGHHHPKERKGHHPPPAKLDELFCAARFISVRALDFLRAFFLVSNYVAKIGTRDAKFEVLAA
jgi:hypothetical protein